MATDYFLKPGGMGTKDGLTPSNAWDETEFIQWANGSAAPNPPVAVPGDNCYTESGTYTFGASVNTALNGTSGSLINIVGVTDLSNPTTSEASFSDSPLFNMGAGFNFLLNDLWWVRNLRITGNLATAVFRIDVSSRAENMRVENLGAGGAFTSSGNNTRFVDCEGIAPNSRAFQTFSTFATFVRCTARDSAVGIDTAGEGSLLNGCLIYDITGVGYVAAGANRQFVVGNTFYNCGTAITGTGVGVTNIFLQNIIDTCTASATWTAAQGTDFWDWNNFFNSGAPSNVTLGPNTLALAPKFVDADGGDFRVQAAGLLNLGLNGAAIGAVQKRFGPMVHLGTSGGARG